MNAAERLRIARGALSRWRDEAVRLFLHGDFDSEGVEAYVYANQLAGLVLRLEREVAS